MAKSSKKTGSIKKKKSTAKASSAKKPAKAAPTGTCIITTPRGTKFSDVDMTKAACKAWADEVEGTYEWTPD